MFAKRFCNSLISIHALLAESDSDQGASNQTAQQISIHALLAESDVTQSIASLDDIMISIHALLAESDEVPRGCCVTIAVISIHALLAESDPPAPLTLPPSANFYPRSPCGERPVAGSCRNGVIGFLSTLSLRRATGRAETAKTSNADTIFLSTLSLRRATSTALA